MQWNHTSHSTNFFSVAVALSPAVYVKSHLQHFINLANLGHFPADISILQNSCGVLPATLRISKATICHGDRNKQSYELTAKPVTSGILNSVHMGWSTPIFKLGPHSSFVHRCSSAKADVSRRQMNKQMPAKKNKYLPLLHHFFPFMM